MNVKFSSIIRHYITEAFNSTIDLCEGELYIF